MWQTYTESIVMRDFANSHHSVLICESTKQHETLNSLIFTMILMFCTIEVMLFKTMIALDLADDHFYYSY